MTSSTKELRFAALLLALFITPVRSETDVKEARSAIDAIKETIARAVPFHHGFEMASSNTKHVVMADLLRHMKFVIVKR